MRRGLALVLTLVCAAVAARADAAAPATLRLVRVARGLDSPVYVTAPKSEPTLLYVVEQGGLVRVLDRGRLRAEPFLDVRRLVSSGGERGLLSIAFHPRYAKNRLFSVDYTDVNGDTRVVEYRSDGVRALPGTARELLFVKQPFPNHNGGQLQFGPDGRLYVGMGDGGSAGDPMDNAQDLGSRLGKILRTDPATVDWQIAGYGLRNPWRFSFDRATGDLYIADVGQDTWEEIDYRERGAPPANFGWARYEAKHPFKSVALAGSAPLVLPVVEYSHGLGCSVTGGYVYRGAKVKQARGRYFYGDNCSGAVWSFRIARGKATGLRREPFRTPMLSSFGEDAAGELYLVGLGGTIWRLAG